MQVDSVKPPFLQLIATRQNNLHHANDVSSHERDMQVDSINNHVETAYGVCNQRLKPEYHKPLSMVAINVNLRHCIWVLARAARRHGLTFGST